MERCVLKRGISRREPSLVARRATVAPSTSHPPWRSRLWRLVSVYGSVSGGLDGLCAAAEEMCKVFELVARCKGPMGAVDGYKTYPPTIRKPTDPHLFHHGIP
jgi:hypothetical protein